MFRLDPGLIRAAYARQAPTYDHDFLAQQRPKILGLAAAAPPLPGPAVDLGAGTGLVARLTGRALVSVDGCAAMLAQAPAPRVVADLWALPFPDGIFAEAWCVTALLDPDDPRPALREIRRILHPDGLLRICTLAGAGADRLFAGLAELGFVPGSRLTLENDHGAVARLPKSVRSSSERAGPESAGKWRRAPSTIDPGGGPSSAG